MSQGPADTRIVDAAINQVLAAEQSARAAVEQCRLEAEALVAAATARARDISAAGERRVRLAHRLADRGIERALAALRDTGTGEEPPPPPAPARVQALVTRLAAELTAGPGGEGSP